MNHPSLEELLEIRDGAGTPASRSHVEECARCSEEIRRLREMASMLRALPGLEPPRDQWPEIREALEARESGWVPKAVVGTIVALAASIIILIVLPVGDPGVDPAGESRFAGAPITDAEIEQLVRESQRLEGLLRRADTAGAVTDGWQAQTVADLQDRIALIDAELADEDPRRGSPSKRARLWRVRVGLMNELVQAHAARPQYVEF